MGAVSYAFSEAYSSLWRGGRSTLLSVITTISSVVQLQTTEAMRGRVMSIYMMAFRGGMPLGSLLAGWVAQRYSVTVALSFNALALALIATGFLVSKARVREL